MKKLYNQFDKYAPDMEFNKDSEEEVLLMLEKQAEITERMGLCLTIGGPQYLSENKSINVTPIYGDKITPYHNHDFYEINYVIKGKIANFVENRPYILEEGDLLIMNPSIHHIAYPAGKVLAKNVILSPELVEKTAELLSEEKKPNYLKNLSSRNIYQIFRGVDKKGVSDMVTYLDNLVKGRINTPYIIANLTNKAEELLIALAECESNDYAESASFSGNANKNRDARILTYISEHFSDTSLEELAAHFGYSTQQIRRIIKKNTGISFMDYLKKCRMGKVQTMLANTNIPIAEIAKIAGYESPEYFSRRFKIETDYTPTEYRRLRKLNEKTKWERDNEKMME